MKSTVVGVVLLVAVASFAIEAHAQSGPVEWDAVRFIDPVGGISVDEAVAQAMRAEPRLRAARSMVDAARSLEVQAGLRPNPAIVASHQTEPAGTDQQTRVEVQWPLDLFRKPGRIAVAARETEIALLQVGDRERMLAANVRVAYAVVAEAVRELAIADELIVAVMRQQELIAARVSEGAAPPIERDLVTVEVRRLEAERLLFAGRAETSMLELKRLLGMAGDAPLSLRDTLEQLVHEELTKPPIEASAIERRPDVREAETRVLLAEARVDRAQREGRLDASVFGMYMRMDAGFPQRAFGARDEIERIRGLFQYLAGGVMLTLPVRDRRQGDIAAARAERASADALREAARLTAQTELDAARVREDRARRAVELWSTEARTLARQNLDVVTQSYELGRLTLNEVLNERRRYLEFERSYTSALSEAYAARQALRRATGEVQ